MRLKFWAVTALLMVAATSASAQNTVRRTQQPMHASEYPKVDLIPMGGYAWTMSMDAVANGVPGEIDITDAAYYGVALDFNVAPPGSYKTAQVRLLWRRQDAEVEFRGFSGLGTNLPKADAAIEYWHIGGVTGIMRGNAMPFATVSLGGTRLDAGDDDTWKFSMIFGLGVKIYSSPKFGFMLQGNWPITFTDTWGGVTVGTGGAGIGIGGTGISQLDVGGGVILRF
jgi:hypothetical protein